MIVLEAADGTMREVGRDEKVVWWLHARSSADMILSGSESDGLMQREPRRPTGGTGQPQWGDEGKSQPDGSLYHSAVVIHGQRYSLGKSDTRHGALSTLTRLLMSEEHTQASPRSRLVLGPRCWHVGSTPRAVIS